MAGAAVAAAAAAAAPPLPMVSPSSIVAVAIIVRQSRSSSSPLSKTHAAAAFPQKPIVINPVCGIKIRVRGVLYLSSRWMLDRLFRRGIASCTTLAAARVHACGACACFVCARMLPGSVSWRMRTACDGEMNTGISRLLFCLLVRVCVHAHACKYSRVQTGVRAHMRTCMHMCVRVHM